MLAVILYLQGFFLMGERAGFIGFRLFAGADGGRLSGSFCFGRLFLFFPQPARSAAPNSNMAKKAVARYFIPFTIWIFFMCFS